MEEYKSLMCVKQIFLADFHEKPLKGPFCKSCKMCGTNVKIMEMWATIREKSVRLGLSKVKIACVSLYEPRD